MTRQKLLTPREAAEVLRLKVSTLHAQRRRRAGPPWVKLGRTIRYRPEDLDAFIAGATGRPRTPGAKP